MKIKAVVAARNPRSESLRQSFYDLNIVAEIMKH